MGRITLSFVKVTVARHYAAVNCFTHSHGGTEDRGWVSLVRTGNVSPHFHYKRPEGPVLINSIPQSLISKLDGARMIHLEIGGWWVRHALLLPLLLSVLFLLISVLLLMWLCKARSTLVYARM